ncbi:presenilin family intramembrane aspartyl protease PSH [Halosimplex halophilum]|uniref:presenilin family intramembrane aspartyl protease PSH n=1 Tax=Halosimplex halophilum TaxID=2559572 RepID=UPI00107EFF5E|nr:presenilin family intramembrane aspartyl protease PSH [Halosimplex halophilum]
MDQRSRAYVASGAIVGIFLLVQLGALALVEPFQSAGYQATADPQDPANSLVYIGFILVMTGVMLAIIRFGVDWLLRLLLVGTGAYIGLFVLRVLVPPVLTIPVGGFSLNALAWAGGLLLGVALWVHPEWYVIDAAGIVMGAGAAGLFGISFGILPALVLLTVLAVYDAISVYGTEHMLTLASGVMELKVPIVLVVPLSLSYSYLDAGTPAAVSEESDAGEADAERTATGAETTDAGSGTATPNGGAADGSASDADADGEAGEAPADGDGDDEFELDREALFIGLGDAVIPTVLVASAAFFAPAGVPTVDLLGIPATLPAVTAMVGTTAGLVVLLWMVLKGRAHAGLPLLNGGTIAGYLLGAVASGLSLAQATGIAPYL